jgi:hypothetical protein
MNFLKNIFKPIASDNKPKEVVQTDNTVDFREKIISPTVDYFKTFYGKDAFSAMIVIWVTEQRYQTEVRSKEFENALRLAFDNAGLKAVGKATMLFETKKPPENNNFHKALDGLLIEIRNVSPTQTVANAKVRISSVQGMGTLMQREYVLDTIKKAVFHIGRGEISNKYATYRTNDIVIKADETDPDQKAKNENVSSAHADIIFRNNAFYLKAMQGGCRPEGGSATKIVRDEGIPEELCSTNTFYPLQDGDLLELGKSVLLRFEIVKDEEPEIKLAVFHQELSCASLSQP